VKIDLDAFLDRGIRKVIGDTITVSFVGYFLFELWKVVLAIGVLDMCEQLCSFSHEVVSAAKEVTGGAHFSGVDITDG